MTPSTLTIEISIHALREESDTVNIPINVTHNISIHALREESDLVQLLVQTIRV